jgi:hypothetical protein
MLMGVIRRRELLKGTGLLLGTLILPSSRVWGAEEYELPEGTRKALGESPLVYISPLHADGRESRCHGEVWFLFDQGDVLISTARTTWKARALASGRERGRIWVGDFGRGRSVQDRFREGPTFQAHAREEPDRAALDRMVAAFGKKYPDEWGKWESRFKKGFEDRSRVLIRYEPTAP